jgi:cell division transport system permease protein
MFSMAGYGIGALFFIAIVLIVANTTRLVLYSRRDEIEIMRLVGATARFIKIPFYIQGMLHGGAGTLLGLLVLFVWYLTLSSHFEPGAAGGLPTIRFFSPEMCTAIIGGGILVGGLGCLVSLKQFMRS